MIGSPASVTESFETSVIVALTSSPCSAMRELPTSRQPAASAAPSPRNLRQDVGLGRRLAVALAAVGSTTLICCMDRGLLQAEVGELGFALRSGGKNNLTGFSCRHITYR